MPVIVVANPKGGVGKTTLATNLAGYFASLGVHVMLGDVDRQQSARTWLALRPAGLPRIETWKLRATRSCGRPRARPTSSSTRPPACMASASTGS